MSRLSVGKKTVTYAATAAVVSALIIVASTLYLGFPTLVQQTGTGSNASSSTSVLAGPQSLLVIQLTDPPQVPPSTKSLNLTYTALGLLVGEPSGGGKVTTATVPVTLTGGSTTLDLLKLQNISQTVASANLPNGSIIYSATFTVSSIAINVNGTTSLVTLAAGGNTFTVTMAQPSTLQGTNVALLQLNPIIVGTPSGYQMIPSAVGVVRHSQGQGEEQAGSTHQLTSGDEGDLHNSRGNLTANLATLLVSGNTTTVIVQVKNIGNAAVTLNAIGLHGNFTVSGAGCPGSSSTTTTTTSTSTTTSSSTTATSHGSSTHTETQTRSESGHGHCQLSEHMNEVVFVPAVPAASTASTSASSTTSTTTSAACTSAQMKLVNGGSEGEGSDRGYTLNAGQCVNFAFTGTLSFGESPTVLVPSTAAGQSYDLHVIASNGANVRLSCALPLGATSCKAESQSHSNEND